LTGNVEYLSHNMYNCENSCLIGMFHLSVLLIQLAYIFRRTAVDNALL